jgi:hypothetical protein
MWDLWKKRKEKYNLDIHDTWQSNSHPNTSRSAHDKRPRPGIRLHFRLPQGCSWYLVLEFGLQLGLRVCQERDHVWARRCQSWAVGSPILRRHREPLELMRFQREFSSKMMPPLFQSW